jgi:hypothetical protein
MMQKLFPRGREGPSVRTLQNPVSIRNDPFSGTRRGKETVNPKKS